MKGPRSMGTNPGWGHKIICTSVGKVAKSAVGNFLALFDTEIQCTVILKLLVKSSHGLQLDWEDIGIQWLMRFG